MKTEVREYNGIRSAHVTSDEVLIRDAQSALDLIATVRYESGCDRIALEKQTLDESFFVLRTGVAGEVLQKFINYHAKLAIIGDHTHYTSKPLKDLIFECNRGRDIFFVATPEEAAEKLCRA